MEFDHSPTGNFDSVNRLLGLGRSAPKFVDALVKLAEDGGVNRLTCGRTRAHGHMSSVPFGPQASDFNLGPVQVGARKYHDGSDGTADVEYHRSRAGTCRLLNRRGC